MVLVLGKSEIAQVFTMKDAIGSVEKAFKELALGSVIMPLRPTIQVKEAKGRFSLMPAYIGGTKALGVKVITAFADNVGKYGLPMILGTVLLHSADTGELLALADGTYITAVRTGAAGGASAKYLARKDAEVVGLFGTGVQGHTNLEAVAAVRKIKKAKVVSRSAEHVKAYCSEVGKALGIDVVPAKDAKDAVSGSDIIITTTSSQQPLFKGEWVDEGTHIIGIGSHHGPGIKEIDETTVKRSKVVVDQREACLAEAGDIMDPIKSGVITPDHIYAELGEIIAGKKKGRENDSEITFFKSVGLAIQDVSSIQTIYELAKKKGVGREVKI
jgi:alanine dehydrogenase